MSHILQIRQKKIQTFFRENLMQTHTRKASLYIKHIYYTYTIYIKTNCSNWRQREDNLEVVSYVYERCETLKRN